MFLEEGGEVLVRGAAYAFALEGQQDGFAGVLLEECVACLQEGRKVLWSSEADGKCAMDEIQVFLGKVGSVHRLDADVEKPDAVF